MTKILIIDDDLSLCTRIKRYFNHHNLQLLISNTPTEGIKKLISDKPDLLLLDVMLPEKDGFTLCQEIRLTHQLPIIMLTARGKLSDKVLGLEIGADDYLPKPFEPRELVARIKALLRRHSPQENELDVWQFEGLEIYPKHHKVLLKQQEVKLTGMEFRLLVLLASNPGKIYSRDEILNQLKGVDTKLYSRSIDILTSRLRQKLDDNPQQVRFIKTLRNVGYTFVARRL